jgi:hypothetical protein
MVVLKTKTKRGYGTVTLEHVTLKDAQKPGITYTGYVVKKNGETISAMRSNKKDATKFFKRECGRTFGV